MGGMNDHGLGVGLHLVNGGIDGLQMRPVVGVGFFRSVQVR